MLSNTQKCLPENICWFRSLSNSYHYKRCTAWTWLDTPSTPSSIWCLQIGFFLSYWLVFLVQVRLRTEVLHTPSSTRPGFKLTTSRSWQHISSHWDACSYHSTISDWLIFLVQVWLRTEVPCTPSLTRSGFELITPALTTRPSVTFLSRSLLLPSIIWLTQLSLKVLYFWKFTSYCILKPLWSGMGEVVPARTSPTLHPPSPPTVHQLSRLAL